MRQGRHLEARSQRRAGRSSSALLATVLALAAHDAAAGEDAPTCEPTGAHARHEEQGMACGTCHPRGGAIEIAAVSFPGGTSSAGSVVDRTSGTATCTTACHAPFGSTSPPVAWDAGPLACAECHGAVIPAGVAVVSSHPGFTEDGVCTRCHAVSGHTRGVVELLGATDSTCLGCHSGTGSTLQGRTGPVLPGWSGASGDAHGERSGQGYGGTLLAPYARGQAPLSCTTCHDAHASGNAFLLARSVNGVAMAPGRITRAGVGAELLCESCHAGDRHARCAECHLADPRPAGAPCLSCHGHEGTFAFPAPGGSPSNYHDNFQNSSCEHCHDRWARPVESTPPVILDDPQGVWVTAGASEATIHWNTDEGATSFVEYGTGELGYVAGDAAIAGTHSVRLTGLAEDTTYFFRIRSSDVMRNVTLSSLRSLMTLCPTCPTTPVPVGNASFDTPVIATTEQVDAWWRDASQATYCGTYASAEMTGASVLRIAAVPREYFDEETQEFYVEAGYGTASTVLSRAALEAGTTLTFDVRPKVLGPASTVSLVLLAFDASGAPITSTTLGRHVFDIFGYSSQHANASLRVPSPVVDTTYTVTVQPRSAIANGLVAGASWADVAKAWLVLRATSGGVLVDVYFDGFR